MNRRNRQSSSRDWQELPKREQKAIREGADALYGGAAKAAREDRRKRYENAANELGVFEHYPSGVKDVDGPVTVGVDYARPGGDRTAIMVNDNGTIREPTEKELRAIERGSVRCPYCGTTDRRKHSAECRLGGFVT